jgi:hypothetical protein
MKHHFEIDAWMGALEWTPKTAESRVTELCAYLKDERADVWMSVVPHISAGLECLTDNSDELHRLAAHIHDLSPPATRKIRAMILASVNAALPERLVQDAINAGALVHVLANKNYTLSQRLTWMKEHNNRAFSPWCLDSYESALETPLKDALALRFYIAATRSRFDMLCWGNEPLPASEVATKSFLERNAPNLVEKIDIVLTLGLSYADAFDMLIDAGDEQMSKPMLDLPQLYDHDGHP